MRIILISGLVWACLLPARAESVFVSPDGKYSAVVGQDEFRLGTLTIKRGGKRLFLAGAGYGGFPSVAWSPDSQFLAMVEHGTKTTMTLAVHRVVEDEVRVIDLPDYRLNILGRFQKVEGGRYQFDEELNWKNGPALQFVTRGSLLEGAGNPKDDPDNWYCFEVVVGFTADQSRLLTVSPKNQDKSAVAGQPLARPASGFELKPGFHALDDPGWRQISDLEQKADVRIDLSWHAGISLGDRTDLTLNQLREALQPVSGRTLASVRLEKNYMDESLHLKVEELLCAEGFQQILITRAHSSGVFLEKYISHAKLDGDDECSDDSKSN